MGNRVAQKLSFRSLNPKKSEIFDFLMFFHNIMVLWLPPWYFGDFLDPSLRLSGPNVEYAVTQTAGTTLATICIL